MSAQKMKAARFTEDGAPQNMYMEEVDMPKPGAMEMLIKIHSTAVNRADTLQVWACILLNCGLCLSLYTALYILSYLPEFLMLYLYYIFTLSPHLCFLVEEGQIRTP